jgi:hypothetical protein
MKFYFRRALFAVITAPFLFIAYGVLYFGLSLLVATPEQNPVAVFLNNLPAIGFGYFAVMVFLPQMTRLVDGIFENE